MKILSKAAAAALVAGTLGLVAFAPAAFAQAQVQPQPPAASDGTGQQNDATRPGERRQRGFYFHRQQGYRGGMGRGVMGLVCSQRGAERLDRMFGVLSNRARLTDAQRPAFDELRNTALAAQTEFADACLAARDALRGGGRPDPVKGMQTRLAIDSARVEAMTQVLPKFEAFYNALSDEQKSALEPARRQRGYDFRRDRRHPGRLHPMNDESANG